MTIPRLATSSCCRSPGSVWSVQYAWVIVASRLKGVESIWGSTTDNKFRNQVRLYLCLHRIRREAPAVLYASRQRHQGVYCIDCCRASAAPLASGSANKSDLFLSHRVLHRSNITRYYHHGFKYITTSLPRMHVFRASICCVIQFGTPDHFGGNITMLQKSYFLHIVVGSLHGVSTCSFFES